jgi:hypothetical protein
VSKRLSLALALALLILGCPGNTDEPTWEVVLESLPGALLSVTGRAADDVWIVGADDGEGPTVLHYDGEAFRRHRTGDRGDLWWVAVDESSQDLWFAGEGGRVFKRPAGSSTFEALPVPDEPRLYGVMPFAANDVWAVGSVDNDQRGVLWRYDGETWAHPADLPAGLDDGIVFFKVWGARSGDVWLVGLGGAALHFLDGVWSRVDVPLGRSLFTVHGDGDVTVAVGGFVSGLVVEVGAGALVDKTPDNAPELIGVHVRGDGSALAVGYEGAIWWRSPAGAWRRDEGAPGTFFSYHAAWVDPAGSAWAVGGFLDAEPLRQGLLSHFGAPIAGGITDF